jgi:D-inositol-3-phosphate glycosyltransferase
MYDPTPEWGFIAAHLGAPTTTPPSEGVPFAGLDASMYEPSTEALANIARAQRRRLPRGWPGVLQSACLMRDDRGGQLMARAALRVLYSFPHPLGSPGIGHTAWEQVANLSALGVSVTVLTTSVHEPLPPAVRVAETMRMGTRRIPHRALGIDNTYAYHDARTAALIRRAPRDFDLVHCWPSACLRTIAAAKRAHIPVFREAPSAHTAQAFAASLQASETTGIKLPRRAPLRPDFKRLRRELREFAAADFILVPSDYVAQTFLAEGVAADRLIQHQYGYSPERFPPPGDRVDEDRPFTAVFVGRIEPVKGVHVALEAWHESGCAELGELKLLGRAVPAYEAYLGNLLRHESVSRLGFVSDVGSVLRRADALVLPSYTEGSALVTVEAMASGAVPLVSSASGALFEPNVEGFVHEVGDAAVLADQLRLLANDTRVRQQMRAAALAASARFTWPAAATRLLAGYSTGLVRYEASHGSGSGLHHEAALED